jgi:transcriptional regulator with PAS, ATPase and Fis domain
LQAKLLRVLQERRFYRVGGTKVIEVNVRVLSATNRDLKYEMEKGRFRQDLYYRLDKLRINVPPLRERKEDIPELTRLFVDKHRSKRNIEVTDEFIEVLMRHNWPGNVRELRSVIDRAMCYVHNGKLTKESLQDENWDIGKADTSDLDFDKFAKEGEVVRTLEEMEKAYIKAILKKVKGNIAEAARYLGLKRTTLVMRMKKFGLKK